MYLYLFHQVSDKKLLRQQGGNQQSLNGQAVKSYG